MSWLEYIYEFFSSGIYDFFADVFAWLLIKATLAFITLKIIAVKFFFDVGMSVLEQLSIGTLLQQYVNQFNSEILAFLTYMKIFDAMNLVLSARIAKYLMKLVGL